MPGSLRPYFLVLLGLLSLTCLAFLIIAFTDHAKSTIYFQYRYGIGVVFIIVTGFLRGLYNSPKSNL